MFLTDKLLTTKYPLGMVLMELAAQLGRRAATLRADWIPRLQNEEADALTNWDFRHFDEQRRVHVDLEHLDLLVKGELFESGDRCLADLEVLGSKSKAAAAAAKGEPRRKKSKAERDWGSGQTLRERDPW